MTQVLALGRRQPSTLGQLLQHGVVHLGVALPAALRHPDRVDRQGDLVSELLLVPYFGACIHTPPPPANQIIHVVLKKPINGLRMMDAYWINGTLDLARGDTGLGVYGYRLKAEAMQPYVEKKK